MPSYGNGRIQHYSFVELNKQICDVKKMYPQAVGGIKCGKAELTLYLRPTEDSIEYTIKLLAKQGSKGVKILVVNPKIEVYENGKKVPHLYSDGSLCLHYPPNKEWVYSDSWSDTIVPWISLWLYYYEMWKELGVWLGGGVHGKKVIPPL